MHPRDAGLTPVAGSIFRPLSQTHISKSQFKNGHISREIPSGEIHPEIDPATGVAVDNVI